MKIKRIIALFLLIFAYSISFSQDITITKSDIFKDERIAFKQTKADKSNLYIITLDDAGKFSYKKLIDDEDSKVYYKVNNGIVNLKNNTVILMGDDKKDTQILKLAL